MMIELTHKTRSATRASRTVYLPWEKRLKSRLRVVLDNNEEAGIFLERGTVLRGGDILEGPGGELVEVIAAPETLSSVRTADSLLLARLCYHLGNRHVPLEISPGCIRYQHDHVLDDMVTQLGGRVTLEESPFEPEHGAYSTSSHGHNHGHHGHE